jgi:hypothetical protein
MRSLYKINLIHETNLLNLINPSIVHVYCNTTLLNYDYT